MEWEQLVEEVKKLDKIAIVFGDSLDFKDFSFRLYKDGRIYAIYHNPYEEEFEVFIAKNKSHEEQLEFVKFVMKGE